MNNKFTSHYLWILLAIVFGISVGYVATKGTAFAYGALYEKTQNLFLTYVGTNTTEATFTPTRKLPENSPKGEPSISIGFVGDIIPGINPSRDIFADVSPYTSEPDIMIGNFEGVATTTTYEKCKEDSINCFSFNGNVYFLKLLADAGFDVLNLANNHFNDYGQVGQTETVEEIQNAGMYPSGLKDQITYITKNNSKIAIVGFSTYEWTNNMNSETKLQKIIGEASSNADIVVVIFHGGGEGVNYTHTSDEREWYLGEDRGDVRSFAHSAIDAGASLVLGSGPHVLRGMEWYNGRLIAYSLGNFASNNSLQTSGILKTSALLEVSLQKDGPATSATIYPFEIGTYGIPHLDLNNNAISAINDLSANDFGSQGAVFSETGEIEIK